MFTVTAELLAEGQEFSRQPVKISTASEDNDMGWLLFFLFCFGGGDLEGGGSKGLRDCVYMCVCVCGCRGKEE